MKIGYLALFFSLLSSGSWFISFYLSGFKNNWELVLSVIMLGFAVGNVILILKRRNSN